MDRVTEPVGYQITYLDGTVFSSSGELQNNEVIPNIISNLITLAKEIPPHEEKYKKISIVYSDIAYVISLSNAKVHIVKLRHKQPSEHQSSNLVNF